MIRLMVIAAALVLASRCAAGPGPVGLPAPEALTDAEVDKRILAHRTAELTLTVTDAAGRPLANAAVTVRQTRHKFLFGCNAFLVDHCRTQAEGEAYRKQFAELLNYATLPFYWGMYESAEGQLKNAKLAAMARWCREQSIRTKGHPLCWHNLFPAWLAGKTDEQVMALQLSRITREVAGFAGSIDTWDVVNEAVVMPDFRKPNGLSATCKKLGRTELIRQTFEQARKANPKATLILNDYDTSPKYEKLIADCLKADVPVDVIGIQSHMHLAYWGSAKAWDVCERFARFGRPLHFTELTILSGALKTDSDWESLRPGWDTTADGEKRQAEQVAELYRVLFSHPAVEAITWWDFADQGAWQGAPAGLVRKDMTPKPAYEALHKLIKKAWWTGPLALTTDGAGQVRFRGFLGDYAIVSSAGQADFTVGTPEPALLKVTVK